jgi:hypothetical protein
MRRDPAERRRLKLLVYGDNADGAQGTEQDVGLAQAA